MEQICEDPIIRHRNMLVEIEQPEAGKVAIAGSPIHLSETPGTIYAHAPLLGEHNEEIYREVLGYSSEELSYMRGNGII